MAISRNAARPYLTSAEEILAEESFPPAVAMLTESALRQRVGRARRLRDKYRDLEAKQAREMKGRVKPTRRRAPTGHRGTTVKRQFFAETLARFEKQLEKTGIAAKRAEAATKKKAAKKALKAALERKKSAAPKGPASRTAKKGMKAAPSEKTRAYPNRQTMRGQAKAAKSRAQARRDSR